MVEDMMCMMNKVTKFGVDIYKTFNTAILLIKMYNHIRKVLKSLRSELNSLERKARYIIETKILC